MKIAIGTDDKRTIRQGHFGESRYYRVIELLNGEIISREYRLNPYNEAAADWHSHGQAEKVLELLGDCSLFMAKSMGKKSMVKLAEQNIDCIITELDYIDEAVSEYLYGQDSAFKYYDARKGALIPCAQRMPPRTSHS
jgi:predicted Fe-Mo cluster-binding NifX family protein